MRKPGGYAVVTDPDRGAPYEWDTCTCAHCQRVVFTKAGTASTVYLIQNRAGAFVGTEAGAFCRLCMAPICLHCHDAGGCTPWEKRLEIAESKDRLRRAVLGG